jgi:hypothetical protein
LLLGCLSLLGCSRKPAPAEHQPSGAEASSASPAVSAGSAAPAAEHEDPEPTPRVIAPSTITLSKEARTRVSSLYISGPDDGVTVNKTPTGWQTAYAPHCQVPAPRVDAALDSLMKQSSIPTARHIESGGDFVLKVVVYAGTEKLLKFALGPHTEHGQLAQMDDGSTVELRGFKAELLPSNPQLWCAP